MSKIKVSIIDDSALVRHILGKVISADPAIEVISTSVDPIIAEHHFSKEWPDVIILDVDMPRMDGITFLQKIMKEHPTPVIMCSALTTQGARITMEAISAGAIDVIGKPKSGMKEFLAHEAIRLIDTIKSASHVKFHQKSTEEEKNASTHLVDKKNLE